MDAISIVSSWERTSRAFSFNLLQPIQHHEIEKSITMILAFSGSTEILIIAALVLLLFGGRKIPELMRGLGKGVSSFKQGMKEPLENDKEEVKDTTKEK